MALSTLERQRLRAALNNIELANRIETMLNYVDGKSDPVGIHQFLAPSSPLDNGLGLLEIAPLQVTEAASINIDIPSEFSITSNAVTTYTIQADTHSSGIGLNVGTGLVTGTAPAFDGLEAANNFYSHLISCQSAYGVITIGLTIEVVSA